MFSAQKKGHLNKMGTVFFSKPSSKREEIKKPFPIFQVIPYLLMTNTGNVNMFYIYTVPKSENHNKNSPLK
jgi:hypothetical protein